jgi:hypothetical protein
MRSSYQIEEYSVPYEVLRMDLAMRWANDRQWMSVNGDIYEHDKKTITFPTHDFCHLIVAAHESKDLAWKPSGSVAEIKGAEYNTVGIEKLYRNSRLCVAGLITISDMWRDVLLHQTWYAGTYQGPFPESNFQAMARWVNAIDPDLIAKFFPTFVTMAAMERHELGVGNGHPPIYVHFASSVTVVGDDKDEEGREYIKVGIKDLKRVVNEGADSHEWWSAPKKPYAGLGLSMQARVHAEPMS